MAYRGQSALRALLGGEAGGAWSNVWQNDPLRALRSIAPYFGGRYQNSMLRNLPALLGQIEQADLEAGPGGMSAVDFLTASPFNPERFVAGLSPFEQGYDPRRFAGRQRFIFR